MVTSPPHEPQRRRRQVLVDIDARAILAVVVALVLVSVAVGVARDAQDLAVKVAIGVVLALALDPLVAAVGRTLRVRRGVAVAVVGLVLAAVVAFVVLVLGPPAVRQAEEFATELPETVEQAYDFPIVGERLRDADASTRVEAWVEDLPGEIDDASIARLTEAVLGGALTLAVVVLAAVAVLIDGELLLARFRRLVPPDRRERVDEVGRLLGEVFGRYFAGSLLVAVIAGLYILTLGLALGIPLAPLAALWMVLVDLIPQVGGFLGGAVFVTFAATEGVGTGLAALVLYLAYNLFENHVLAPAIVGKSVNLSPPATMMAAFIGGAAVGVPGALVATPIVGAAKALYLGIRPEPADADGDGEPDGPVARLWARRPWRRRPAATGTEAATR